MILVTVPALASEKLTEAQFVYRYTALLGIAGVDVKSSEAPKTVETQPDGGYTIMIAKSMITVDPTGYIKSACTAFQEKEIIAEQAASFLLALDPDFSFDQDTNVINQVDIIVLLAKIVSTKDVEYCGYKMTYTKLQGIPVLTAQ